MEPADESVARQEREEAARAEQLRAERAARSALTPADSADECEGCGQLIPSARQVAVPGCTHCIECAALIQAGRL